MALPVERDITLYRGDVYEHLFTFVDDEEDPMDLSTYDIAAQWRTRQDASTAVDFAVDDTDAATGQVNISLTPAQTAVLGTKGVYDVQITDTGEPETLVRGSVTVTKDVTRP